MLIGKQASFKWRKCLKNLFLKDNWVLLTKDNPAGKKAVKSKNPSFWKFYFIRLWNIVYIAHGHTAFIVFPSRQSTLRLLTRLKN